jgi:hypothetical protein
LAQVNGLREQHSSEEKARYDLQYIFHWSLFLDISLLVQTAWTFLVRWIGKDGFQISIPSQSSGEVNFSIRAVLNAHRSQSGAD